jgi:hypothetical protein
MAWGNFYGQDEGSLTGDSISIHWNKGRAEGRKRNGFYLFRPCQLVTGFYKSIPKNRRLNFNPVFALTSGIDACCFLTLLSCGQKHQP